MNGLAYEQYKDSGIPGLGLIPQHWQVQRIKDDIIRIASGVTPKGGGEVYVDEGTPFLRSQNVHDDGLRLDNVSFITEEINSKMRASQTKPGDIVLNITGASIGRSCVVPATVKQANISQHILLLRFKKHRVAYAAKYIQSCFIKDYIDTIQVGASKQALNMGQTLNFPLLLPPQEEQAAMTEYLDHQTAAIDRKIDLLEQKTKLYQTLRKTLINETVCRGLNPEAPRKDSGIEWIGEIPAHWEVKRLKDVARVINGSTPASGTSAYWDGEIVWVTPADFGSEKFVHDSAKKITKSGLASCGTTMVPAGSVILSARAPIGSLAIASKPLCTNQGCKSLIPFNIQNTFLYYFLTNQTALLNSIGNGTIFKELSTSA